MKPLAAMHQQVVTNKVSWQNLQMPGTTTHVTLNPKPYAFAVVFLAAVSQAVVKVGVIPVRTNWIPSAGQPPPTDHACSQIMLAPSLLLGHHQYVHVAGHAVYSCTRQAPSLMPPPVVIPPPKPNPIKIKLRV